MAKQAARPQATTAAKPIEEKTISSNRQARYEYELLDRFEAGIVLTGSEIKSVRGGRVNLRDAYVRVDRGEAWLVGAHISPYERAGYSPHEPDRPRKLLLHRDEIVTLRVQTQTKGLTIVPLRLYFKGRRAKVEIAVGRGKKLYDKRATLAERDARRDMEQRKRDY
jgi:SsrA-binding protein